MKDGKYGSPNLLKVLSITMKFFWKQQLQGNKRMHCKTVKRELQDEFMFLSLLLFTDKVLCTLNFLLIYKQGWLKHLNHSIISLFATPVNSTEQCRSNTCEPSWFGWVGSCGMGGAACFYMTIQDQSKVGCEDA